MTKEDLFFIGDAIMLFAVIGSLAFTISYATFFAWRSTAAGRSLMYFVLSLDAWAIQSFASRMVPNYPWRELVRIAVYSLIAITIWRLTVTLWRSWGGLFDVKRRRASKRH